MSYDYIRRMYHVDPKVGQRITHYGKPGVIMHPGAAAHYLQVRFDGESDIVRVHPTDEVDYAPAAVTMAE